MIEVLDYLKNKEDNKIAAIYKDESVTYKTLIESSKIIATNLLNDIKLNDPVIVFMDKSIQTLETFFGILYAGGCYSLINSEFPNERIIQIRDVLNAKVVVTNKENYEKAQKLFVNSKIYLVDELLKGEFDDNKINQIRENKLDIDPVYINFTSGSTGTPKGVIVSNRSIIDFINVFTEEFNITKDDIIANQAPFDFDVSVKDIYSSICMGATLLIVPREYFSSPSVLIDYLVDNRATTLIWAVSALCLLTTFHALDYKIPNDVNKVIFSGEVMPLKHLKKWMEKLPNATYINVYGPTEITCNCTYHIIDPKREYTDAIPIGKPFKNEKVFLLSEDNKLIENENVCGEICVSGTCLSLGYYHNPSQNEAHFCQNPLNDNYFERIYKTGDLGKYNENHELVFAGRKDFQIKYQGHRIELEEIDKAIMKNEKVIRVCTIFDEVKSRLYAFYIGDISEEEIRNDLSKSLPVYMIPTKLIKMDQLPLTKNGKIDRKSLFSLIGGNK